MLDVHFRVFGIDAELLGGEALVALDRFWIQLLNLNIKNGHVLLGLGRLVCEVVVDVKPPEFPPFVADHVILAFMRLEQYFPHSLPLLQRAWEEFKNLKEVKNFETLVAPFPKPGEAHGPG